MKNEANIMTRAYLGAVGILKDIEQSTTALIGSVEDLDLAIGLMDTTAEFNDDLRADVIEALSDARNKGASFQARLEQILTRLDVSRRAHNESTEMTKRAREKVGGAAGTLRDVVERAQDETNLIADAATVEKGRDYLDTKPERLRQIIRLAGVEVIRDLLAEIEVED